MTAAALVSPTHAAKVAADTKRQSEIGWLAWSHEVEAAAVAQRSTASVPTYIRLLPDGRCSGCGTPAHGLTACK